MHLLVDRIIYFYIFVCISLLIFNVLYIMRSGSVKRKRERRRAYWIAQIKNAMERAFDELTEHGWYHNTKLVSDGLALYPREPQELVRRLWSRRERWMDSLAVAVAQYAADIPGDFSEEFFETLTDGDTGREIKFALIRYFRKKTYPPCRAYFQSLLAQEGQELAIAAAAALDAYPGEDTKLALKEALSSPNWYVRRNAALSLRSLGITGKDVEEIKAGGDRFAREMLEYVMEERTVTAG